MTKFLIVEDHAEFWQELKRLLNDLGEIYECSDGAEAFSAYSQHQPDWGLMDIRMCGLNGLAATRAIKAVYPDARIVIVTGYDDAELREAALRAGACEYVVKECLIEIRQLLRAE